MEIQRTEGTTKVKFKLSDGLILYYPNEKSGGNIIPKYKKINWKKVKAILDRK